MGRINCSGPDQTAGSRRDTKQDAGRGASRDLTRKKQVGRVPWERAAAAAPPLRHRAWPAAGELTITH